MSTKEKMRAFRRLSERALQASRLVSRGLRESISAAQAFLFASAPRLLGTEGWAPAGPEGGSWREGLCQGPPA